MDYRLQTSNYDFGCVPATLCILFTIYIKAKVLAYVWCRLKKDKIVYFNSDEIQRFLLQYSKRARFHHCRR